VVTFTQLFSLHNSTFYLNDTGVIRSFHDTADVYQYKEGIVAFASKFPPETADVGVMAHTTLRGNCIVASKSSLAGT
jgi:hypothetical protein